MTAADQVNERKNIDIKSNWCSERERENQSLRWSDTMLSPDSPRLKIIDYTNECNKMFYVGEKARANNNKEAVATAVFQHKNNGKKRWEKSRWGIQAEKREECRPRGSVADRSVDCYSVMLCCCCTPVQLLCISFTYLVLILIF